MCDLKRRVPWPRPSPNRVNVFLRNARCEWKLRSGDAFGHGQNRLPPVLDRRISATLFRATKADLLLTWVMSHLFQLILLIQRYLFRYHDGDREGID